MYLFSPCRIDHTNYDTFMLSITLKQYTIIKKMIRLSELKKKQTKLPSNYH